MKIWLNIEIKIMEIILHSRNNDIVKIIYVFTYRGRLEYVIIKTHNMHF